MSSGGGHGVPPPHAYFGHGLRERPAHCHEIVEYVTAIAAASDRVALRRYGKTAGGRQLIQITVTSPANLANLEGWNSMLGQLGDSVLDEASARDLVRQIPAVVWFGCGIHGDEISGPDASVELLHRLAFAHDCETLEWLDQLVIHLDPLVNPDGRERYLAHLRAFASCHGGRDLQDILHQQRWPDGRGNHYWFDLNRDAIFTVQAESRARAAAITAARPQLCIDAHEMAADDTFLFAVPAEPLNPHLPPEVHESWRALAADHAAAFDRDRVGFYTRSWNEVFYPGFFDIWPAYHGAVPVLYEQAATSGVTVRLPNGRLRTYDEAIANVLRSACANLATAAGAREKLLLRWWRARSSSAVDQGRAWIVLPGDTYKARCMIALLSTQGVRVEVAASECSASGLHSPWGDQPVELTLPKGTLLIRGTQPLGALVRNIFDFHVPLPGEFIVRERERIELGMKTSLVDVTAWSLPLAYGADAYWTDTVPGNDWRALGAESASSVAASCEKLRYGTCGYLYEDHSLHVTARLLARGVNVRVAREPFTCRDRLWRAGTFLIRQEDQHADVLEILRDESHDAAEFVAADSARILDGPDLGGQEFDLLSAPSVGILAGPAMNAPSAGALRYLFDAKIGVAATLLDVSRLSTYDLSRYNVLLLGDTADSEAVASSLVQGFETLRHWLCCGGTLVAMSGGAQAVASTDITACRARSSVVQRHPPVVFGASIMRMLNGDFSIGTGSVSAPVVAPGARVFVAEIGSEPCEDRLDPAASIPVDADICTLLRRFLPRGAYVRADFRPRHWLRYGVRDRLAVLFRETDVLIAGRSAEIIGRYAAPRQLALAGLIWPEAVGYIAQASYLTRERLGRGQVILIANDPVFRGYSLGTERLLLNAAVLGPGMRFS